MILKKNDRTLWGIPYQGSKTKIIDKIAKYFPNADHFYDLFGGGFSVTHFMIINRKSSYKHFHYNELRSGMCEFIRDAINGKYNYDVFKPEWITRERFFAEKELNPYIKIIWSFGNNGKNYLFGEDIESDKKSMHQAVVFDEFDDFMFKTFDLKNWPNHLTITGKRLYLRRILANKKIRSCLQELERIQQLERLEQLQQLQQLEQLQQLQQLERLEQLQQLQRLEQLQRLNFTNKSYEQVEINKNSVIYCDIPYFGTADYGNSFSHAKFFDWANQQENPVFISEYLINDPRFFLIKEFKHRTSFSAQENSEVTERLYGNQLAFNIIEKHKKDKNG